MKIVLAKYPVDKYREIMKDLPFELINEMELRDMDIWNMYVDMRQQSTKHFIEVLKLNFKLSKAQVQRAIAKGRKHFNSLIIKRDAA